MSKYIALDMYIANYHQSALILGRSDTDLENRLLILNSNKPHMLITIIESFLLHRLFSQKLNFCFRKFIPLQV